MEHNHVTPLKRSYATCSCCPDGNHTPREYNDNEVPTALRMEPPMAPRKAPRSSNEKDEEHPHIIKQLFPRDD